MIKTIERAWLPEDVIHPMNFVGVNAMFCIMTNMCSTMRQNYTAQDAAMTSADCKWQMSKFVWKMLYEVIINELTIQSRRLKDWKLVVNAV
jgi:hypothetical protein